MKTLLSTALAFALAGMGTAHAFQISLGSDGSYGAINVTSDTVLTTPADGVFHATTITVAAGATLSFTKNELNTGIVLLATGDVVIDGTIDVSGQDGVGVTPGQGGPGGFAGSGYSSNTSGNPPTRDPNFTYSDANQTYPQPYGGAGGRGETCLGWTPPGNAAGGGGGALIIFADGTISASAGAAIDASGGAAGTENSCNVWSGSTAAQDGSVRLAARSIDANDLAVTADWIRFDALQTQNFPLNTSTTPYTTSSVQAWRAVPTVRIVTVDGFTVPEDEGSFTTLTTGGQGGRIVQVRVVGCVDGPMYVGMSYCRSDGGCANAAVVTVDNPVGDEVVDVTVVFYDDVTNLLIPFAYCPPPS